MEHSSELACTYASLILHDDGIEITAEKIESLLTAANVKFDSYWPSIFAKALATVDVAELLTSGGGAAAPAAGGAAAAGEAAPAEEEKKEEEEEEEDDDMGFGLFD
eukprot:GCRY01000009.1.p1 GENE.GCRY01000009.1~~GCRY01000009.1.p1  ORF type:complete len:106 (+),score=48.78 GCRY01000009.1:82-399(+)